MEGGKEVITLWILGVELQKKRKESESRVKDTQKRNQKKKRRRGDWCSKLRVFEGMTQPLIQVFKYLMQGGIKQDRLATELSVKTRIYYRESLCVCVCACVYV